MIGVEKMAVPHALVLQIADIDEFKGLWRGLDDHTTGLKLIGDVAQHNEEFHQIVAALKDKPLTIQMICHLHALLSNWKGNAGDLKAESATLPFLKNGTPIGHLDTAAPEDVKPLLEKLLLWVNQTLNEQKIHPLIIIGVFSGIFLQISPFAGRNTRLMRFITMILLMKSGYSYAPYALLDPIMNDKAEEILASLRHNQRSLETGKPDWSEWLTCFMGLLQAQKNTLLTRLYSQDTMASVQNLPALSIALLEHIRQSGRMTMKEAIKATNGRRSTIKLRLHELLEAGLIHRHGAGRGVWYALA